MAAFAHPKLVRYFLVYHGRVQCHVAFYEKVIVAAIDVEAHFFEFIGVGRLHYFDGCVLVIMRREAAFADQSFAVEITECSVPTRLVGGVAHHLVVGPNGCTERGGGGKKFGVFARKKQRTQATHGEPRNGPKAFLGADAVGFFDEWHELSNKKIFVARLAVVAVHVPRHAAVGHGNNHGGGIASIYGLVGYLLRFAKLSPARFVVGIAVEEV